MTDFCSLMQLLVKVVYIFIKRMVTWKAAAEQNKADQSREPSPLTNVMMLSLHP